MLSLRDNIKPMKSLRITYIALLLFTLTASAQQVPVFDIKGRIAGSGTDYADLIETDASGNLYVSGRFTGICDFDPGTTVFNLTATGTSSDIFLAKYSNQGALVWAKSLSGIGSKNVRAMRIDVAGNLYLVGDFTQTMDLDPGPDSTNVSSVAGIDGFLAKYTSDGNFLHGYTAAGANTDYIEGLAFDSQSNVYLSGEFGSPSVDIGAGLILYNSVGSGFTYEPFILKLDSTCSILWGKSLQGPNSDYMRSIAIDAQDRIVVGGNFSGSLITDSITGTSLTTAGTQTDCFIARYANDGTYQASWSFGGNGTDNLNSLTTVGTTTYAMGIFNGNADLAPGADTLFFQSRGNSDVFLISMQDNGLLNWATTVGGTGVDNARGVRANAAGEPYLLGEFLDSADFTPSIQDPWLRSYGNRDGFASKYNPVNGQLIWAYKIGSVQLDYMRGIAFDSSGDFCLAGYYGGSICYFEPLNPANNLAQVSGTDAFFCRYGECTYPQLTGQPASGGTCPGGNTSFTVQASGQNPSFQWQEGTNGGIVWTNISDGGVYSGATSPTLSLTGLSTTFNNRFYRCIVSVDCGLSLTSGVGILFVGTPDTSVSLNGTTLSGVNVVGASYQWLNCNNNFAQISGATAASFTPTSNGNYALQVTRNGCTDTSACYTVSAVGLDELQPGNTIRAYPNPTGGELSIDLLRAGDYTLQVMDLSGKLVVAPLRFNRDARLEMKSLEAGTYLLEIRDESGNSRTLRIVRD